jgi:hypothetical protein
MKIPIFVSVGTRLSDEQIEVRNLIYKLLDDFNLEPRTIGRSDYAMTNPLREVVVLARHCAGALVLGFGETFLHEGTRTSRDGQIEALHGSPQEIWTTPWGQIEAGLTSALGLPLLIFRDKGVSGGVFDIGSSGLFIQEIPTLADWDLKKEAIREVLQNWRSEVHRHYYGA